VVEVNRATASDFTDDRPRFPPPVGLAARPARRVGRTSPWRLLRPSLHALLLVLAVVTALVGMDAAGPPVDGKLIVWAMPIVVLVLMVSRGTYRRLIQLDVLSELLHIFTATSLGAITILAAADLLDHASNPAPLLVRAWVFATAYLCASVPLLTAAERHYRRLGKASRSTLVVGAGVVGSEVERGLAKQPELGLRLVGYIDTDLDRKDHAAQNRAPILGLLDEFTEIVDETGARHVIFTFTSSPDQTLVPLIRSCEERHIEVSLVPRMFEHVNHRICLESIGRLPLVSLAPVDPKGWQFTIKHGFDRLISAVLLLLLSPLLTAIAVSVRISSPGPVLFRQQRIGRDGRRFEMLKFRSMRIEEESSGSNGWYKSGLAPGGIEGDDRRTAIGRFIRSYSLDELHQLINVVKGEMSLIGPRPERPEFVQVFDEQVRGYSDRHRVKSGITGLAQTSGLRGQTSLTERIDLDNHYIQNWSMILDLKILVWTIGAMVRSAE
jgi:exopolysaccharide biosynthesis polyprenyl glycosylphosphotransferase